MFAPGILNHLFNKYLLSTRYVPGIVWVMGYSHDYDRQNSGSHKAYILIDTSKQ